MYEHELQNMASLVEEIREDEIEGGESDFSEEIEQCNRFLQSSNKIFCFLLLIIYLAKIMMAYILVRS